MSSDGLKLISYCAYLTDTSNRWREEDYTAMNMVKALKGEPISRWFDYKIGNVMRRFDESNLHEFVERIPRALARHIERHFDQPATLVPIPNACVTSLQSKGFKTLQLAQDVARACRVHLDVRAALVFAEPQVRSRKGGPRKASHFESVYRITADVSGPIILLDDVCTGGGHLVGAYWKLHSPPGRHVVLACTFGRTTKEQLTHAIGPRVEHLETRRQFVF
jgi:phosphoribosylpyrophosphate synthetase